MKQRTTSQTSPPPVPYARSNGSIDTATLELLAAWKAEDATTDPEKLREADEEIAAFKTAMNENRAATLSVSRFLVLDSAPLGLLTHPQRPANRLPPRSRTGFGDFQTHSQQSFGQQQGSKGDRRRFVRRHPLRKIGTRSFPSVRMVACCFRLGTAPSRSRLRNSFSAVMLNRPAFWARSTVTSNATAPLMAGSFARASRIEGSGIASPSTSIPSICRLNASCHPSHSRENQRSLRRNPTSDLYEDMQYTPWLHSVPKGMSLFGCRTCRTVACAHQKRYQGDLRPWSSTKRPE